MKRVREDESSELDLPEVKKLRDDLLLGILDESEPDFKNLDLDSVMKSFEDEISSSSGGGDGDAGRVVVVDLTSDDSGESQPDLGYLLEASDDELGLPPSVNDHSNCGGEGEKNEVTELVRADSADNVLFWGFDEQVPNFDSFELGIDGSYNTGEYATFDDGLFEYSNVCFDYADCSWRLGTRPAAE